MVSNSIYLLFKLHFSLFVILAEDIYYTLYRFLSLSLIWRYFVLASGDVNDEMDDEEEASTLGVSTDSFTVTSSSPVDRPSPTKAIPEIEPKESRSKALQMIFTNLLADQSE